MPRCVIWAICLLLPLAATEQQICGNASFTDLACSEAALARGRERQAPRACEAGGRGFILPVGGDGEHRLPVGLRVVIYVCALGVCVSGLYFTSVMLVCWSAEAKATDDVGATDANFFEEPSRCQCLIDVLRSAGTGIFRVLLGGSIFAALMALYFDLTGMIGCMCGFSETAIAAIAWPLYIAVMVAPAARRKCCFRNRASTTANDRAPAARIGVSVDANRPMASPCPVSPEIAGDAHVAPDAATFDDGLVVSSTLLAIAAQRPTASADGLSVGASTAVSSAVVVGSDAGVKLMVSSPAFLEEARTGEIVDEELDQEEAAVVTAGTAALASPNMDLEAQQVSRF